MIDRPIAAAAVLLSACWFVPAALGQTTSSPPTIDRVAWLQGCWESGAPPRTVEESWMAPRGGAMVGMGRTIRDGKLIEYELVVIREQDGRLAYHAHPSGQPSAVFLSTTIGNSTVLFENPRHDFPQKVGYRLDGDHLVAWIEGVSNGEPRRVEFPNRRSLCPA